VNLIHLRAVSPADLTDRIIEMLGNDDLVVNLVVLRGASRNPDGDAIECDVLAGAANRVLRGLRELEIDRRGSIIIEPVELAISGRAAQAESHHLEPDAHAPVWEEVESRIRAQAVYAPSFYLLLTVASIIGAVGILTNSQILIVAAMVVGPEYSAIVNVALGLDRRSQPRVRAGLKALLLGFLLAIAAALVFGLVTHGLDLTPTAYRLGIRPVSALIDTPNFFSAVVAVLAGIVGVVALTEARSSALLGVFISVTTIPAAADVGVSLAYGSAIEARGSILQLLLNIVVLIVVGFATLRFQRYVWRRIQPRQASADSPDVRL
jgi:uncharacterized hydrophobic protein (TIGR00271 family)